MTPLSEALTAAQRSALAALEKAYVAGQLEPEAMTAAAEACGISDPVDLSFLLASLDVLREWGVAAPTMTERVMEEKKATEKQISYITELMSRLPVTPLAEQDIRALTTERASKLIEALKNGTYREQEWDVPVLASTARTAEAS